MRRWGVFATHVLAAVCGHLLFWVLTSVIPALAA